MTITAALVNELREKTGAGMMDCKKALVETNGNLEEAVDFLRKKGVASAAKKTDRGGKEGSVAVILEDGKAVALELNCETDFVAKNEQFQALVQKLLRHALVSGVSNLEQYLDSEIDGKQVKDFILENAAVMGENLTVSRVAVLNSPCVFAYVHNAYAKNSGKIAVLVELDSNLSREQLKVFGEQLAMQIAAARPLALSVEDVGADLIEREKSIFTDQARASGKPDSVIEKMIEGRIRKFYEEIVLLEQVSIFDNKTKIRDLIAEQAKALGGNIVLKSFKRFELGEGA